MDGSNENPALCLHREFITAGNIESLFARYNVPKEFTSSVSTLAFQQIIKKHRI